MGGGSIYSVVRPTEDQIVRRRDDPLLPNISDLTNLSRKSARFPKFSLRKSKILRLMGCYVRDISS